MTDPEFLAEARQRQLAIEPKSGEDLGHSCCGERLARDGSADCASSWDWH
jgi:hypothetical protein